MLIIVGALITTICVFGGYGLAGGDFSVVWQPIEMIIIFGAAAGAMIMGSPGALVKRVIKFSLAALSHKPISKEQYIELLMCLFEICKQAKQDMLSLEAHVENPENSDIFKRYPGVMANHHAMHFICDTMKVLISAGMSPFDLEELMDKDIESAHNEELAASAKIATIGDAMPGLGIVAAVLGVVITMGKLNMGKEVIGHSVGAALIGTFLGILVSYGYFAPLAAIVESNINEEGQYINAIKMALLSLAKDSPPKVCVEFARRSIPPEIRPSFEELDEATSAAGKKAA